MYGHKVILFYLFDDDDDDEEDEVTGNGCLATANRPAKAPPIVFFFCQIISTYYNCNLKAQYPLFLFLPAAAP